MHRRAGFTLVELLVALVISGILATVIFQVIQGQGRFVQYQNARGSVQQSTRGGLELLTSELRAVPAAGIIAARKHSIGVRVPLTWGIVCRDASSTSGSLHVAVPVQPVAYAGADAKWSRIVVDMSAPGDPPRWSNLVDVAAVAAGSSSCNGTPLPAGSEMRAFTVSATPTDPSTNAAAVAGNRVLFFEWIIYSAVSDGTTGETWIVRQRGNNTTPEKVAQAVPDAALLGGQGLEFLYYTDAGGNTPLLTVDGVELSEADKAATRRVGVIMATQSRRKVGSEYQQQVDTSFVFLRNRP